MDDSDGNATESSIKAGSPSKASANWASVLTDAADIADTYREDGWTVVTCETRDVVPWSGGDEQTEVRREPPGDPDQQTDADEAGVAPGQAWSGGFDVLVSDPSFEATNAHVESVDTPAGTAASSFGSADVYRQTETDTTFVIAVERDDQTETVIVVPLYYRADEASRTLDAAREAGELLIRLRAASHDDWLTFSHDDPSLFVPVDAE